MAKRIAPSMTALQCFEASARHLSFTDAAYELNLTQSAVSKQVAQLEQTLCHSLFERIRKRLYLTPAGSLYLTEVNKILVQVDISSRYILSYGGDTEVLSVATQPTFGARWLMSALKGFTAQYPNIHLDIRSELEPFDLLKAKTDVAFFFGQGTWPGSICIELFEEEVVPVCSPELLRKIACSDVQDLSAQVLLQCASRPEAWHEWFFEQGLQTCNSYHGPRFDTFYMCICAARVGLGVALIPRYLVTEELEEGKLVIAWPHWSPSKGKHYLAHSDTRVQDPKIRKFIDWIVR